MPLDARLKSEFASLWRDAAELWDRHEADAAFEGYVGSDFTAALAVLESYQDRAATFLEWGSGLGVVTIMAARMGFEACGIEVEPELVEWSEWLADKYQADARFACGSFIPDDFTPDPRVGDEFFRTATDSPAGYDQLDRELADFDLVYAYPWPDEHRLFGSIMRRRGGRRSVLIRYDNREGITVRRCGMAKRRQR